MIIEMLEERAAVLDAETASALEACEMLMRTGDHEDTRLLSMMIKQGGQAAADASRLRWIAAVARLADQSCAQRESSYTDRLIERLLP